MSNIKTITGTLNKISSGVVTSGSSIINKSMNLHEIDFIEINDERWGNFIVMGTIYDELINSQNKEITIHYIELKNSKINKRLIAGIQVENEKLNPILVDDISPILKSLKKSSLLNCLNAIFVWAFIGGFISIMVGYSTSIFIGWSIFVLGGIISLFLGKKTLSKTIKILKEVQNFAIKNNRVK